ncbi:helix-turn-helix domain-containing protein [Bacillus sp. NMTD17]|uniref:helix-turn-helix domain-containing protein n=1 Tax=Bacillus sp. NMTD17 TaxID=2108547 RepID=UPI000D036C35|nr:helix-turn-helix transcriptional regulator [Bacillus sp. NMTD17]PRS72093.1 XRE family transcriptional regulator [Bacillus sp. NMTD17]
MSVFIEFGKLVRRIRIKRKLSQTELGEMTGFSASFISRIENGNAKPSIDAVEKISKILNIEVKFFLTN